MGAQRSSSCSKNRQNLGTDGKVIFEWIVTTKWRSGGVSNYVDWSFGVGLAHVTPETVGLGGNVRGSRMPAKQRACQKAKDLRRVFDRGVPAALARYAVVRRQSSSRECQPAASPARDHRDWPRRDLIDSLAIMLSIVVPTIAATLASPGGRASNARATYLPDWEFGPHRAHRLVHSLPPRHPPGGVGLDRIP